MDHHQLPHQGRTAVIDVFTTAKKPFYLRSAFFCIGTMLEDENHHTSCLFEVHCSLLYCPHHLPTHACTKKKLDQGVGRRR